MQRPLSNRLWLRWIPLVLLSGPGGLAPTGPAIAQPHPASSPSASLIVPQCRRWSPAGTAEIQVQQVDAGIVITEQVATTTLDITLRNTTQRRQTAELLLPVPAGAVVRSFSFQGAASEPTARLLERDEARKTFDSIVARLKDPALLEFAGMNLVRSSVFPVEPGGQQKVRLTYEQLLAADGDRVDYVLPRSQSLEYRVPWTIHARIESPRGVSTVYSPTHPVETQRSSPQAVSLKLTSAGQREPGPFRLSYLVDRGTVTASMFTYPRTDGKGGYFLLLAGVGSERADASAGPRIRRELTLVLDRSGSMAGEKLEQARQAALQVLEGLKSGESFNLVIYNDAVEKFAPAPVIKNAETLAAARNFLEQVTARGGTNLHDALAEALRPEPLEGALPIVMFLTDGLPTVGNTSEQAIRSLATESNPHARRIFTFGVGVDVNTPLLDKLAVATRGFASFVLPGEDVELAVSRVFRGLDGPTLAAPRLQAVDAQGQPQPGRLIDLLPSELPDLYGGQQLVLLGRYLDDAPLRLQLQGSQAGRQRTFVMQFDPTKGGIENAFVPRLWAGREIGRLIDLIRDLGAVPGSSGQAADDPRLKELTEEVVRLSTEFGILTEYTAFLAREGTDLSQRDQVLAEARGNFVNRALTTRSGLASVNQELNNAQQRNLSCLNLSNHYWNANLESVSVASVQQLGEKAFYRRGSRWIDGRFVQQPESKPAREIEFGSVEFQNLLRRLVGEGRQCLVALDGDILLELEGQAILIKGPARPPQPADAGSGSPDPDSASANSASADSGSANSGNLRVPRGTAGGTSP